MLIVNHALFVTDLALRAAGFGLLPEYHVAIFDEAHTLEAVAGEHLGLQLSSVGVDYTLARLYNERTGKGLLGLSQARRGDPAGAGRAAGRRRLLRRASPTGIAASQRGFNGRVRQPLGLPEHVLRGAAQAGHGHRRGRRQGREAGGHGSS